MSHCVVVGFDGSEIARATLSFAARRLGTDDRLVVAHVVAVPTSMLESPYYDRAMERSREHGRRLLDQAKGALPSGAHADLRLVEGPPARTLVELAREVDADEIAVGSRGFGSFRAAALGSLSHALLHESDRPVLVVTRRAVERELRLAATAGEATKPPTVVVGYDGSDNARAALDYASRRVEESGGDLVAVCAFYAPADWLGAPYYQVALDEQRERVVELTRGLEDRRRRGGGRLDGPARRGADAGGAGARRLRDSGRGARTGSLPRRTRERVPRAAPRGGSPGRHCPGRKRLNQTDARALARLLYALRMAPS